jgi:glycerol-3-phosphate dehydrogenase (NAD(P)+)
MTARAAVMGAGSWGTTFAKVLVDACVDTTLWARRPELADDLRATRHNRDYLPQLRLPDPVRITSDPAEALAGADFVLIAVPAQALRRTLTAWAPLLPPGALLISLMKGIETGTGRRMSEVIREVTGAGEERVAVISGPNLAHEIADEQPAATVVACVDEDAGRRLQAACANPYLRPYTNLDVIGCELGGAVKNIIAILVGIAEGQGYGDNTRASIITRGLAETMRLGAALGADPLTFSGLAGLGDLLATCASPLSRNRTFGVRLGRGATPHELLAGPDNQVVEGVATSRAVLELAREHDLDMPVALHVVKAVSGEMAPSEVLRSLMARRRKSEQFRSPQFGTPQLETPR